LQLPLHTARLLLREFIPADDQALQAYASDPEVTRFMVYGPQDAAETAAYLQRMLQSQRERPRRVWGLAVTRREDAQLIGACDVTLEDEQAGNLSYLFACEAWEPGYVGEAVRAVVDAGFAQFSLEQMFATCVSDDRASARVLEEVGFQRMTVLRKYQETQGRWWDLYLYEISRTAWRPRP
jgi:[ribosomal protein S5]-alanine N-acetyltransferase